MQDYMPYMQMMNMPKQYCPMMEMPQQQMEQMYPQIYFIIFPHVKHHCDMLNSKYGMSYTPTRDHMEAMVDDIERKVEMDVDMDANEPEDNMQRQFGFGRRRIFRDLISILLIRQLLGRRRPYYGGYPGGYGGYDGYGIY